MKLEHLLKQHKDERTEKWEEHITARYARLEVQYQELANAALSSEADQRLKVTPGTFIQIAEKNPTAVGVPVYWAEWPSRGVSDHEGGSNA